jgi:hypothetical protein
MVHPVTPTYGRHHLHRALVRFPGLEVRAQALIIGIAVGVLLTLVVLDASLYENRTAPVQVTTVNWYARGALLTTSEGFTLHTSQQFNLTLECVSVCYRFNGAAVSSPFSLVSTQVFYYPGEFLNLTLQAPSTSYSGPLAITLSVD